MAVMSSKLLWEVSISSASSEMILSCFFTVDLMSNVVQKCAKLKVARKMKAISLRVPGVL